MATISKGMTLGAGGEENLPSLRSFFLKLFGFFCIPTEFPEHHFYASSKVQSVTQALCHL